MHTVILKYFNIKEEALSNFVFQSLKIFIDSQNKKNFSNNMVGFCNNPIYPFFSAVLSTWMEPPKHFIAFVKIKFCFGANERLEGKIGMCLFCYVKLF